MMKIDHDLNQFDHDQFDLAVVTTPLSYLSFNARSADVDSK